eukprot:9740321-Alexandrium_andersonii.AAC.1
MVLWGWRSHRLKRVGNSSYMVETYGLGECLDACQLLRGVLAEARGWDVTSKRALEHLQTVVCAMVVDAKDTHD